eukprot:3996848-Pyramimonas_sp.AAC.1
MGRRIQYARTSWRGRLPSDPLWRCRPSGPSTPPPASSAPSGSASAKGRGRCPRWPHPTCRPPWS